MIGGGIQGVALALELAGRGVTVELFEARAAPMQEASRENEGKVHLGFVYANDASLATAQLMWRGAFAFATSLRRWLERDVAPLAIERPFFYVVHRASLIDAALLGERYAAISRDIAEAAAGRRDADYFGRREVSSMRRLDDHEAAGRVDQAVASAVFESSEVAVDPVVVADLLAARVLADPGIHVRTSARVVSAELGGRGVFLSWEAGSPPEQRRTEDYDQVFNCAWAGRLIIDATLGIRPARAWSFRRKYFLRVPNGVLDRPVDPTTIVLGPFGDIVQYASGELFLSWYPAGCRGIETGLAPTPADDSTLVPARRAAMVEAIVFELGRIVPDLRGRAAQIAAQADLRNGVIFALGATDIDDRHSLLHQRRDVGVRSFGPYHTVDTGKYSLAPLFAREMADRVTAGWAM